MLMAVKTARTYPVGEPGVDVDQASAPSCAKRAGAGPRFLLGRLGLDRTN